jgi:hypothetical protein
MNDDKAKHKILPPKIWISPDYKTKSKTWSKH